MARITFTAFDPAAPRHDFDCGNDAINEWFRTQAGQQERRDAARTTLGWIGPDPTIASFCTLVAHHVDAEAMANTFGAGRGRYGAPAALIAQLGVDVRYQGRGIGAKTLSQALRTIACASELVGCQVVVVDAINASARDFYLSFGFKPLPESENRLSMRMREVRAFAVRM